MNASVNADPHIGGAHGFDEFVRVVEDQATLLVTAEEPTTPFENWRPMLESGGGANEWLAHSGAWAEEWAANTQAPFLNVSEELAKLYPAFTRQPQTPWPCAYGQRTMPRVAAASRPWNTPTTRKLAPGEQVSYTLPFRTPKF